MAVLATTTWLTRARALAATYPKKKPMQQVLAFMRREH
jgi:hypothetical protein